MYIYKILLIFHRKKLTLANNYSIIYAMNADKTVSKRIVIGGVCRKLYRMYMLDRLFFEKIGERNFYPYKAVSPCRMTGEVT